MGKRNKYAKTHNIDQYTTTVLCFILHLLGDYILQRYLSPLLPSKRTTIVGLLAHAFYADLLVGVYLGVHTRSLKTGIIASLCLFGAHLAVDALFNYNKVLVLRIVDQLCHIVSIHIIEVFILRKAITWTSNSYSITFSV